MNAAGHASQKPPKTVAIVDYEMGNLLNVARACERAGLDAKVTRDPAAIRDADCVILPGVGAFGDAMEKLREHRLVEPLCTRATSGRLLVGICLGLQLFFDASEEFGDHKGLGLMRGRVVRFRTSRTKPGFKVPHMGWTAVDHASLPWEKTPISSLEDGEPLYFVHSYYVAPVNEAQVLARSTHANVTFASAVRDGNVYGFQFHPERSGRSGLKVYENIARSLEE